MAGTAAVLSASGTEFVPDLEHRTLIMMRGALEGQWVSLAYLSAGSLLEWVAQTLWDRPDASAPDFDELTGVGPTLRQARTASSSFPTWTAGCCPASRRCGGPGRG